MTAAIALICMIPLSMQTVADSELDDSVAWPDDDIYSVDLSSGAFSAIVSDGKWECPPSVALIGNEWLERNTSQVVKEQVCRLLDDGTVIIFKDCSVFGLVDESLSNCYFEGSTCYALAYDSDQGVYNCYSDDFASSRKSINSLDNWIKEINAPSRSGFYLTGDWGSTIVEYMNKDCGEWGSFNTYSYHYWVNESNYALNQYACKYSTQIVPASGHCFDYYEPQTSLTNVGDVPCRYLCYYSPTETVYNNTITVSLGFDISLDPSLTGSIGWTYTIPDITVNDLTEREERLFKARYNCNGNYEAHRLLEPGFTAVVDCDNGTFKNGNLTGFESHTVRFYKTVYDYFLGFQIGSHKEYGTYTITYNPNIKANPCTLTIDGNGESGNYLMETHELEYQSSVSTTFAQGGHTSLNCEGYYKYGYTLAGFSTDPNATVPSFSVNQDYKVNNDSLLYCIWQEA